MYYLYILKCADDTLYTGITANLERRVWQHNFSTQGARYTRSRRPVKLVYKKEFETHLMVTREELRIKKLSRKEKLKIIGY